MNLELPLRYRTYMASCTRNFFVTLPTAHATLIYFFRHIGSVDTAMHGYTRFKPYTVADIFILQYFLGQLYCLCLWGKNVYIYCQLYLHFQTDSDYICPWPRRLSTRNLLVHNWTTVKLFASLNHYPEHIIRKRYKLVTR